MKTINKLDVFNISRHTFIEKPSKLYLKNHSELNIFRREMEYSHNFYAKTPYSQVKKKTLIYKSIFLGLGLLFLVLSCFICLASFHHPIQFIFNHSIEITKKLASLMSVFTGFSCLFIFYVLNPELEILNSTLRKHKNQLSKHFIKKQILYKINSFILFGAHLRKKTILCHHYKDSKDKLSELKCAAHNLLIYINSSKDLHPLKKELLCNQAVLELEEKLGVILDQFEEINLNELDY